MCLLHYRPDLTLPRRIRIDLSCWATNAEPWEQDLEISPKANVRAVQVGKECLCTLADLLKDVFLCKITCLFRLSLILEISPHLQNHEGCLYTPYSVCESCSESELWLLRCCCFACRIIIVPLERSNPVTVRPHSTDASRMDRTMNKEPKRMRASVHVKGITPSCRAFPSSAQLSVIPYSILSYCEH